MPTTVGIVFFFFFFFYLHFLNEEAEAQGG